MYFIKHWRFVVLVVLFLVLVRLYEHILPPLEHMDADTHFAYITKLRNQQQLPYPPIDADDKNGVERQSGSPPLYYLTAAILSSIDQAPTVEIVLNPWHAEPSSRRDRDNRYLHLMNPDQHVLSPAQVNYIESVHGARLASHLFSLMTLCMLYGLTLQLWHNKHYAHLSVAFVAFNPKFLQLSAAVTNDSAAIAFSALILWLAVVLVKRWKQWNWLVLTGIAMGLGALSKANTLTMWSLILVAIAYGWFRDAKDKPIVPHFWAGLRSTIILMGVAVTICGWWFARAWILFNDPLGFEPHRTIYGNSEAINTFLSHLPQRSLQMWGDLGTGTVEVPNWSFFLIGFWLIVTFLMLRKLPIRVEFGLFAISIILGIIGLWRWTSVSFVVPGRLMMPYFVALAPLVGWGIGQYRRLVGALFVASLAAGALIVIVISVYYAFAAPRLLDEAPKNLQGQPLSFTLPDGDTVRFLGYRVDDEHIEQAGDVRTFHLCWQGLGASDHKTLAVDFAFSLEIVTVDLMDPIGKRQSVMGLSTYTRWKNGAIFCDTLKLRLDTAPVAGHTYRLVLSMFDYRTGIPLPADGLQIGNMWHPAPQLDPQRREDSPYIFGDIVLVEPMLTWDDDTLQLQAIWSPRDSILQSYKIVMFLHNSATNSVVKQIDVELGGDVYPAWAWREGECIPQEISIPIGDIPQGEYTVRLGIYDPTSLVRVPTRLSNDAQADGLLSIGQFTKDEQLNAIPTIESLRCNED